MLAYMFPIGQNPHSIAITEVTNYIKKINTEYENCRLTL